MAPSPPLGSREAAAHAERPPAGGRGGALKLTGRQSVHALKPTTPDLTGAPGRKQPTPPPQPHRRPELNLQAFGTASVRPRPDTPRMTARRFSVALLQGGARFF
jgi:hypothetical protein